MKTHNTSFATHSDNRLVWLHGNNWLEKQRVAGRCVSEVMLLLEKLALETPNLSLKDLSNFGEQEIIKRGCQATFKNYHGFPSALCLSVNKQLVHGVASDYQLANGDVLSIDFGATYEGAIADSAKTIIIGEQRKEYKHIIEITRQCLYEAIKSIKLGSRLGSIGFNINKIAKNHNFNVVENLGGHSLSWNKPHAFIFIPNKSPINEGIRAQAGMTLAIEPLLVPYNCSTKIRTGSDGWTVYTDDIGSHSEHTIYLHKDHIEIITWRPDDSIPSKINYRE